ncbi:MAG: hypothetical protein ISR57_06615 [Bacteroidales bacterium]|nr:hypothetical protein [Bacteroidales bacterium]
MIHYLKHTQIDKFRWDQCIRKSVNSMVYGFSWYLDLVSPGWDALMEDDYTSVFPLTRKQKLGFRYLAQPFFTQQLGLFTTGHLTQDHVTRFLDSIPAKFKLIEIHLNSMNKVDPEKYEVVSRINHELELMYTYEELSRNYSKNTRRNLKKAMDVGIEICRKVSIDELVVLFQMNFGQKEGKLCNRDYLTIKKLIEYSQKRASGILLGAGSQEDQLNAGAFFLKDQNRFILLFAASDLNARQNGSMFLLLDAFIREHANQPLLLDFEGGNDPNLGRFYKSFGARETTYPFIRVSRIPFL